MPRKELAVEPREVTGKKVATLRRAGVLPANIFGHGIDSLAVQLRTDDLEATIKAAAANEVIDLKVAGEAATRPVVIHKVQRHPLGRGYLHADFYQVSLREKIRVAVPIVLVGTSEAVTTYGGVLLAGMETLNIEALPLDIPTHLEVDISSLRELDSALHVRDLQLPPTVTVLSDPDVVLVQVSSPRVSVEGEAPAAAATAESTPAAS